jgi:hypothetical protein
VFPFRRVRSYARARRHQTPRVELACHPARLVSMAGPYVFGTWLGEWGRWAGGCPNGQTRADLMHVRPPRRRLRRHACAHMVTWQGPMQGTGSDRCCVTATYTREGYVSGKEQEVIDAVSQLRTRGKGTYLLLLESRDRARDAYNAVVRWGAGCPGRLCGAAVTLCAQRMHVKLLFTVVDGVRRSSQ